MAVALSDADVAGMLEVLHEAAVVDGPDAFTEPVVDALRRLLPVDAGSFCNVYADPAPDASDDDVWMVGNPRVPPEQRTIVDYKVYGEWAPEGHEPLWQDGFTEAFLLYGAEEELVPPVPELMLRAVRESDLLSYREMRKRRLWWEIERHLGVDSLALWLPSPEEGVLRRLNFTTFEAIPDRYVQILQLLAPHFVLLYRRAAARRAAAAAVSPLTPREREIMVLVAAGKANKEIARELWLSTHTVRSHLENVFEKLEVRTRSAAVARAFGDPAKAKRNL
jgi:DNA-binding CsgD family transcriptional regulator